MTTPGECYGCVRTNRPLKQRIIRTHPLREPIVVNMCDECMRNYDRTTGRMMKERGTEARRLAEIAGRMGGEPDGN